MYKRQEYGWTVTDVGVRSPEDTDTDLMFHRIGLRVGSMISEGEFERALIFCGTGTVSYTHLDVYKRQLLSVMIILKYRDMSIRDLQLWNRIRNYSEELYGQ